MNEVILTTTKQISRALSKNSPSILTGFAVAGLLSTVILAVKATPQAMHILKREEKFREEEENDLEPIDIVDTIDLTWKCYIPTFVMGVTTITCMIGANSISLRRNAALASLFSITETALKEYQAKVVETIGEKKEEKIRDEIAQEKVINTPPQDKTIILTGKGEYLCLDSFSGRYFRSNIDLIHRAENAFNHKLIREGWMDINQFYDELGLEPVELGNEMGWIAQYAILDIRETVTMTKEGEPCLVMEYRVQPKQI